MVHTDDASAKRALRLILRNQRKDLSAAAPDAAERAAQFMPSDIPVSLMIVAGYQPRGSEIDCSPLMRRLAAAGSILALPVAVARDAPLSFRAYRFDDPLEPDAYGVPSPTAAAREVRPDLVIVPLLAFDRAGGRLGQGGGHYDRTLAALRANGALFAFGLAYAGQEVAQVPSQPHDQRLDAILTERAYIGVSKGF